MPLGTAARAAVEDIIGEWIENGGRIRSEQWGPKVQTELI